MREDTFQIDGDHYFTYEDLDSGDPKKCVLKKLMRFIAFPPNYEMLKINWFDGQKNKDFHIDKGRGFATVPAGGILTFEVNGFSEREDLRSKEYQSLYSRYAGEKQYHANWRFNSSNVGRWS